MHSLNKVLFFFTALSVFDLVFVCYEKERLKERKKERKNTLTTATQSNASLHLKGCGRNGGGDGELGEMYRRE